MEVFRAKHHGPQDPEVVRKPPHRLAVQAQVALAGRPIKFDLMFPLPYHAAADEVTRLPVPDHLRAAHAAERAERGHEINRFDQVGLAWGVIAKQKVEARREIRVQPRVIAEITKPQMSQVHDARIGSEIQSSKPFL